ncbi:MAG: F0F1 ATP synthase subunit B [Gammaproteobacteria bacterium]|nr:MAG: F0F1 ATP synthase subunit B [Gammaproteobacteria bacterium]
MNINLTLVVQMLVFALLVFGTMRFIWPHILDAMEERSRKIAQGLAAAEQGEQELAEARDKADAIIREARERASHIIEQAQHAARDLVEQAKGAARSEGARILAAAQQQIELDTTRAREALRREVAGIAVRAASKLLAREIDARTHADLLDKLTAQI